MTQSDQIRHVSQDGDVAVVSAGLVFFSRRRRGEVRYLQSAEPH